MAEPNESTDEEGVMMPAPTPWPMVLAFGLTFVAAGLVTQWVIAAIGIVIGLIGAVGWGRVVHGPEGHVWEPWVPHDERASPIAQARTAVESMGPRSIGHRMLLPAAIHPYSSGARGGIAGGVLMAAIAAGYGVLSGHGLWYPVNLLAGVAMFGLQTASVAQLEAFHPGLFVVGLSIHAVLSVGLGVLYGVLLPMLPGHPILWGGIIAPLLWTGGVYEGLSVINPLLADYVSWPWFLASQLAYGIVAGYVIERSVKVVTRAVGRPSSRAQSTGTAREETSKKEHS